MAVALNTFALRIVFAIIVWFVCSVLWFVLWGLLRIVGSALCSVRLEGLLSFLGRAQGSERLCVGVHEVWGKGGASNLALGHVVD